MKKELCLLVGMAIFLGAAGLAKAARSFKVSYADPCSLFYKGYSTDVLISWQSSGGSPIQGPVNILLVPELGRAITIATGVWNNGRGQYGWTIPGTIPDGRYRFRIALARDPSVYGESKEFQIVSVPNRAELIAVTEPPWIPHGHYGRRVCYKGTQYRVKWSAECGLCRSQVRVPIYLVSEDGSRTFTLATDAILGQGSYYFITIPSNTPTGRYRIKIETFDRRIWGQSDPFEVVDLPNVSITNPRAGSVLYIGRSYHITWRSVEVPNSATVKIYLIGGNHKSLLYQGPNNRDFLWKVGCKDAGTYRLRIEVPDYRLQDEVSNIAIRFPTIKAPRLPQRPPRN